MTEPGVPIDFARLVRRLREVRGLTQEQLARELGVTFSSVNGWENRKHRPSPILRDRLLSTAAAAGIIPATTDSIRPLPSPQSRRGRAGR